MVKLSSGASFEGAGGHLPLPEEKEKERGKKKEGNYE